MKIEFYILDNDVWYICDNKNEPLTEKDSHVIKTVLNKIREFYPEAYRSLCTEYQKSSANDSWYYYLIVRRFIKCNFGKLDTTRIDIDNGVNFEKVECPLRGECKLEGIVCQPKFNASLSVSEDRVMRLVCEGLGNDEISEKLCISPNTVKTHIQSSFVKVGVHSRAEFVKYANDNNLYERD